MSLRAAKVAAFLPAFQTQERQHAVRSSAFLLVALQQTLQVNITFSVFAIVGENTMRSHTLLRVLVGYLVILYSVCGGVGLALR